MAPHAARTAVLPSWCQARLSLCLLGAYLNGRGDPSSLRSRVNKLGYYTCTHAHETLSCSQVHAADPSVRTSDRSRSGPHKCHSPHIPVSVPRRHPLPSEALTLRTQHARPPIHKIPPTRQRWSGHSSAQAAKISRLRHQGSCAGGPNSTPAARSRQSPPLQCWWVMYWGMWVGMRLPEEPAP